MRQIISDICTLMQHLSELSNNAERYRPHGCCYCGHLKPRKHGHYPRKADRESTAENSLNPIMIPRFYCSCCKRTFSVLPECIPPRRWYLWHIQQACLLLVLGGRSLRQVAKQTLPSRWTVSRWVNRLKAQFKLHSFKLKSNFSELGYCNLFERFWKNCLDKLSLAKAMLALNKLDVIIP
ncbi:MAG: transposase [Promethearchaeota archaeon]|jgi:transposase-like protein